MAKLTRKWIELDWSQTNSVLRAEDIPYSVDQSIKDAITTSNGKVAITGGEAGFLDDVLQPGNNVSFDVNGSNLTVSSQDKSSKHEQFVVTTTNITNGYVTTSVNIFDPAMVTVSIAGGTTLYDDIDYYVDGNNIVWTGKDLANYIEENDVINVVYTVESTTPGALTALSKVIVTENYSAASGNELLVDTSGGAIEILFPSNPLTFDEIKIVDAKSTFNTNSVTINRNGKKIKGTESNIELDVDSINITFIYYDESYGWTFKM